MNTLINFVVKWDRPWEIGSFHLSWRSRIQLQLNNDLENYVESNYQIWPDEIVESHGNQAHRPPQRCYLLRSFRLLARKVLGHNCSGLSSDGYDWTTSNVDFMNNHCGESDLQLARLEE